MEKSSGSIQENPIIVISYIKGRGALVHVPLNRIPIMFNVGNSYSAKIEILIDQVTAKNYNISFEFKAESPSATKKMNPSVAVGMIEGLDEGPSLIQNYLVKDVRELSI